MYVFGNRQQFLEPYILIPQFLFCNIPVLQYDDISI